VAGAGESRPRTPSLLNLSVTPFPRLAAGTGHWALSGKMPVVTYNWVPEK
jgi:hypothetical protein